MRDAGAGDVEIGSYINSLPAFLVQEKPFLVNYSGYAVLEDRSEVVEFLLDAGADINGKDEKGRVAVDIAIKHQSREAAQVLVDRGASFDDEQASQLAKLGVDVDAEPAGADESRREEVVGRWELEKITYEGDPSSPDFRGSVTHSAEQLGFEDTFVEFHADGSVNGKYIVSTFEGSWTIDENRVTRTEKLHEPTTYRLTKDGQRLQMTDYDEEHAEDMYVKFVRAE